MSDTKQKDIIVAGIVNDSITDGPGLRLTVFTQGCDKRCPGCHNPQTHPLIGGTVMTADQIFDKIRSNPLLKGVTLSGGEPFLQAEALVPLARRIKSELGLEIAAYTGDILEDMLSAADPYRLELISLCDTIIDGPYIESLRSLSLRFKGSANQRIIDVPATLKKGSVVIDTSPRWNKI